MSGVSPYVFYALGRAGGSDNAKIKKMDFGAVISGGRSTGDTVTTVADPSACPAIPNTSGANLVSMNDNDTRWLTVFGGGQDRWFVVFVWDAAQHCRWFNMATFTFGGDWGPSGSASYYDETGNPIAAEPCSSIHNVRMSRDGRWAVISTFCGGGAGDIDFWDIATAKIYRGRSPGDVPPYFGGGHKATGFNSVHANNGTYYSTAQWFTKRTIPPLGTPTWLTSGSSAFDDSHESWNNQTSGQLQPMIASIYQTTPPTLAWGDEIVGISMDGSGIAYRFAHMYTRAHDFNAQGMANVSRDGKWAIFTSDWTTTRDDVFLVPLK